MSTTDDSISDQLAALAPQAEAPLSDLQTWMTSVIGHTRALHRHPGLSAAAGVHFSGNARLSPAEQLNIYRVQFWLRHTAVLIEHFEGLSRFLGQDAWQPIAQSYLARPDTSVLSLADLGHKLAQHIAALPSFPHQQLCVDMAQLEWAYQRAFTAGDDPTLSAQKLQSIPADAWADARFTLADSLQLLELKFPVADLRRALRADLPFESERLESPTDIKLAVYRRDYVIYDKQLSPTAFSLLQELARGSTLIFAYEAVMEQLPEAESVFGNQLQTWFTLWGRLGWIVDVHVER